MGKEKLHSALVRSAFPSQNVEKKRLGPLLEVRMCKICTYQLWATFGSWDVEKAHAAVAQSTFSTQCTKQHEMPVPHLELRMLKNYTRLWPKAVPKFDVWQFGQLYILERFRRWPKPVPKFDVWQFG